jgi:Anp1
VLVLTPLKDAARYLGRYVELLEALRYPRAWLSLGLLESDSADGTFDRLVELKTRLAARCRRVQIYKRDFGFRFPKGTARWAPAYQLLRRSILARSRNHLLFRALDDEDWVLWIDVDVIRYPADILKILLATKLDIVHPHCVREEGGRTFDLNAWSDNGTKHMQDLRDAGGGGAARRRRRHHAAGARRFAPRWVDFPTVSLRPREPRDPAVASCLEPRRSRDRGIRHFGQRHGIAMLGFA